MEPERWQRLERVCQEALDHPESERAAFLEAACAGDESLRREAEALLGYEHQAENYLDSMPLADQMLNEIIAGLDQGAAGTIPEAHAGEIPGTVIGHYCLRQRLGQGGMGEVWLADQREPVRRRVALKLVKAGLNSREVIGRFETERQAVAMMNHPAIAKVFDAGSTPQGVPYFVMEYVPGTPITAYCDNHRLSPRERLELFMRVCEGVQHAHQKAIIHRDLKPSNILVTEVDNRAAPKIIDFGVAKALAQKLTEETLFTRSGGPVGTPEYMSPEQALSSGEDIDTRTDVYSLGVIFYELLVGTPPIQLNKIAFDEFLRRLRDDEPPKPSTRIRTHAPPTSTDLARKRRTEPLALAKQIRGDLDWIALKALEKERSRRYGSPSEFSADIARYLNNEAVLAAPPSVAYRARKFAHRYRGALVTGVAFAAVLVAAALVSVWQSVRATQQRDRADAEAAVAQAVNDFLQNDLLAQASAARQSGKPDRDLKVRTALDRAAARVAEKFNQQPEVEAAIRDTIGQTYIDLGLYPEAKTQLEQALALHRRALGRENPKTLKTMSRLGRIASLQGEYTEAEGLINEALGIQRRVLGPEHPDTLVSMNSLATVYYWQAKYAPAEALNSQIMEIRRRVLGPQHPDTLGSAINLALDYVELGRYAQAEALLVPTLEIERRVKGPEHPETLKCMNNLAVAEYWLAKYAQAEALYGQAIEIERRVLGAEHPDALMAMHNLAALYDVEGKYPQAEVLLNEVLVIQRRALGPEHPDTLRSTDTLANVYIRQGKYAQAEVLYGHTLEIQRRVIGPEHLETLRSLVNLAFTNALQGKYAQAEALFSQDLAISRRVLGPEHPETLSILPDLASTYQRQGKYALAETYAAQALAGRRHALGSDHPDTMASADDLALAYISQKKFGEGEPLAREALEFNQKKQPDDWQRFRAETLLGSCLAGQKKYAEAEPLLLDGYHGMMARIDRISAPDHYHLRCAREWIVELYEAWGKPAEATKWRRPEDVRQRVASSTLPSCLHPIEQPAHLVVVGSFPVNALASGA
jgi:hypothetical protein